ncbi:MAG: preprotein translocase subunit SecE [bacterium]
MKLVDNIVKFISDVNQEMSKVSWPNYEELKGSTVIVVILSLILAIYIFASDTILRNIIQLIF